MNFIILFLCLIISIEIIIKFKYIFLINSLFKITKKAGKVIFNKKISDHWKEKIITAYSFRMIKFSLSILLIFVTIFLIFFVSGIFLVDLPKLIFSFKGIFASILFGFGYIYVKKVSIR